MRGGAVVSGHRSRSSSRAGNPINSMKSSSTNAAGTPYSSVSVGRGSSPASSPGSSMDGSGSSSSSSGSSGGGSPMSSTEGSSDTLDLGEFEDVELNDAPAPTAQPLPKCAPRQRVHPLTTPAVVHPGTATSSLHASPKAQSRGYPGGSNHGARHGRVCLEDTPPLTHEEAAPSRRAYPAGKTRRVYLQDSLGQPAAAKAHFDLGGVEAALLGYPVSVPLRKGGHTRRASHSPSLVSRVGEAGEDGEASVGCAADVPQSWNGDSFFLSREASEKLEPCHPFRLFANYVELTSSTRPASADGRPRARARANQSGRTPGEPHSSRPTKNSDEKREWAQCDHPFSLFATHIGLTTEPDRTGSPGGRTGSPGGRTGSHSRRQTKDSADRSEWAHIGLTTPSRPASADRCIGRHSRGIEGMMNAPGATQPGHSFGGVPAPYLPSTQPGHSFDGLLFDPVLHFARQLGLMTSSRPASADSRESRRAGVNRNCGDGPAADAWSSTRQAGWPSSADGLEGGMDGDRALRQLRSGSASSNWPTSPRLDVPRLGCESGSASPDWPASGQPGRRSRLSQGATHEMVDPPSRRKEGPEVGVEGGSPSTPCGQPGLHLTACRCMGLQGSVANERKGTADRLNASLHPPHCGQPGLHLKACRCMGIQAGTSESAVEEVTPPGLLETLSAASAKADVYGPLLRVQKSMVMGVTAREDVVGVAGVHSPDILLI